MNNNNKMLERVLLMMKYDSSKTLTENSDVVRNEFAQLLNEAPPNPLRILVKFKQADYQMHKFTHKLALMLKPLLKTELIQV